jgi:hypothetical protein
MKRDDVHQLVLTPLADRSWRLCDRSVARSDAASVVAYVELLETGMYEAIWVSVGFGSTRYPSMEALFRAAVRMLENSHTSGALKPQPIPHRPPAIA